MSPLIWDLSHKNIGLASLWPTIILHQWNSVDTIGVILIWSNKGKSKANSCYFIFVQGIHLYYSSNFSKNFIACTHGLPLKTWGLVLWDHLHSVVPFQSPLFSQLCLSLSFPRLINHQILCSAGSSFQLQLHSEYRKRMLNKLSFVSPTEKSNSYCC